MLHRLVPLTLLLPALVAVALRGDESPAAAADKSQAAPAERAKQEKISDEVFAGLMKKKLDSAQKILEALATDNAKAVASHARTLRTLGALEHWLYADAPEYKAQLNIYHFANGELVRLAEEGNLDGASLAYVQLTLSCVNCHKYLRQRQE